MEQLTGMVSSCNREAWPVLEAQGGSLKVLETSRRAGAAWARWGSQTEQRPVLATMKSATTGRGAGHKVNPRGWAWAGQTMGDLEGQVDDTP